MSPKGFRVALVGYGYAGKTFHAPLIAATPGLELTWVVSSDPSKVKADFPSMQVAADLATALADPTVDLVVIATPNEVHAPQAHQALSADKHVVVDKPFTVTLPEAKRVVAHAEQANKLVSVFQNRRWDGDFLTLQRLIGAGALGEISLFESRFDRFRPTVRPRWREGSGPGAGCWHDLAPHLIDQALCLFGQPLAMIADIARQRVGAMAPDYFHAVLIYQRLRVILHSSCLTPASDLRFAVHGSAGSLIKYGLDRQEDALKLGGRPGGEGWGLDDGRVELTRVDDGAPKSAAPPVLDRGDYGAFYRQIVAALAGQGENPVPPAEALAVMALLQQGLDRSAPTRSA